MDALQRLFSESTQNFDVQKSIDFFDDGNGPPISSILPQLLAEHDDTLFAWTGKCLVAVTGVKTGFGNGNNGLMAKKLTVLHLTCVPFGKIIRLEINRAGSYLALICTNFCYVVEIPRIFWFFHQSTKKHEIDDEYLCKCIPLDANVHDSINDISYLRIRWHPGSPNERHLFTLKSDNVIRIYNVDTSSKNLLPVQCIILSRIDSFAAVSPRAQNFLSSIGESAVSFDFGPPISAQLISKEPLYPVFVLYGNGDVYSVLTDLAHLRHFPVCGPLTITPASEDNYGVDSCDILTLSSSKSHEAVTVLVIATSYGNLYHAVVFAEESTDLNDEAGIFFSLHVYESVELEFSLSTLDIVTRELKEDSCASPVCLYRDKFALDTYYCQHGSGLHIIRIPWIHDFEAFNSENSSDTGLNTTMVSENTCSIDYRLCTCPKPTEKFSSICGLASLFLNSSDTVLITLLPDFNIHASLLPAPSTVVSWSKSIQSIDNDKDLTTNKNKQLQRTCFLDHLKNELKRNMTIPVLKAPNKNIPEKEAAEILLRSISILKTAYIDKLTNAQNIALERCEILTTLWPRQKSEIESLLKRLKADRARHDIVVKRSQKIKEMQLKNAERLDFINMTLAERSHSLSSAEENMLREMQKLKLKLDVSMVKIKQLDQSASKHRSKLTNQNLASASRSIMPNNAETELQKIIKTQGQQIESLMANVKRLQES